MCNLYEKYRLFNCKKTKCQHFYHQKCLIKWLKNNNEYVICIGIKINFKTKVFIYFTANNAKNNILSLKILFIGYRSKIVVINSNNNRIIMIMANTNTNSNE